MLRHLSVELDHEGISEWVDAKRLLRMSRAEIVAIEVGHGVVGVRVVLQVLLGIVLVVGGAVLASGLAGLYDSGFGGGAAPLTGACLPVMMLGAYIVWWATRPCLYLRLRSHRGARTIALGSESDVGSLAEILSRAGKRFGYRVEWTVAEPQSAATPYRDAIKTPHGA